MEFPYYINTTHDQNIDNAEINTMYSVIADLPPPPPPVLQQILRSRLFRPVLRAFQSIRPPLQLLHHFVSPLWFNVPRHAVAHFQPIFPHTFRPIVPRLSHHRYTSEAWNEGLCFVNFSHRLNWEDRRIVATLRARVENGRALVRGHFTHERTARIEQYYGCGFVFYELPQVQWDAAIITFYGTLDNWDAILLHLYDVLTAFEQGTEPPNIGSPTPNFSQNSNGHMTPENAESPSGAVASPNAADPSSSATNSSSVTGSPNAGESSNAANSSSAAGSPNAADSFSNIERGTEPPKIIAPVLNSSPVSIGQQKPESAESSSGAVTKCRRIFSQNRQLFERRRLSE
ncbi:hypothetical protein niasHS_001426 [Heterodera schachtii]|uniref:Uncharacterized protein n=1 Tax=Heterodera schachtii TaxID=97005 RepID=A0ABD2KDJ9_HETSC